MLDLLGNWLTRAMGKNVNRLTAVMMTGVSLVSAFMNNTTVTAIFVGPVIGLARQIRVPSSRLLMPLAFASIMGGTCTLIGTSTNVAVSGYLEKAGHGAVGMFETTALGLILVAAGTVFMMLCGIRLMPDRATPEAEQMTLREYLAEVVILPSSPLIDQEVYSSDFSVLGFQVMRILRAGAEVEATPHEKLQAGDLVLVAGQVTDLIKIKKIEGLDIKEDLSLKASGRDVESTGIAEVVLTPRSGLVGTTLRASNFRQLSGLSVLAVHRGAQSLVKELGELVLEAGDVLLMQGPHERLRTYEEGGAMVVLNHHHASTASAGKGPLLLGAFALAVLVAGLDWMPASVVMLMVAVLAVLMKCVSLETAYQNMDWRLLILIGGMMAFGQAMTKSGAADWLAGFITTLTGPFGPHAVLAGFCLLTVLLTQPMSNAAAALVVLPVALQAAELLGASPRPFAMGVMLSASVSMLTPFEPSCILVYGPGKYRFRDFLVVGGGVTLVLLALIIWLVPVWWPLSK
jgi:di/tricarboxylate transporter